MQNLLLIEYTYNMEMKQKTKFKETEIGEIPEDWKVEKLFNLIDIKHGYAFKGEYFTGEINNNILLTPGNFKIGGGFKADKFKYYTGDILSDYILKKDDLILNMTDLSKSGDTLGYPALIPENNGKNFLHNQRLGLVKIISNKIDKSFLYWIFRTRKYQKSIVNSATGSTVKHTSPNRIKEYSFAMPTIMKEQKQIAKTLSELDSKIELLQKQNQTLERIGQALFKRWFVDFEFPNEQGKPYKSSGGEMVDSKLGEIPKGWRVKELKYVCEIQNGFAFKSKDYISKGYPIIRTRNFNSNNFIDMRDLVFLSNEKARMYKNFELGLFDFLLVMVGASIGNYSIVTQKNLPGLQNQNMWNFRPLKENNRFYLIYKLKQKINLLKASASGSARDFFRKDYFYSLKYAFPNENLLGQFDLFIRKIYYKLSNNLLEIELLKETRDKLLPELMSGKIRVRVST